ncbi:MAG: bifunctional 2-polyprenyl-6-hydroxyphenol methylase/3-demethylubiquinol 3-O-methyltransferase UbiG [Pseudomonadota bacterium]
MTTAAQGRDRPRRADRNDLTIYDSAADAWWDGSKRWVRTLANMVPARLRQFEREIEGGSDGWRNRRVLDLGCAGGFMAEAIAAKGGRVTGIDPAADAIAAARAHAAEGGLDIRYDVGVGEALPYPDDQFDLVVCVDVLEHVESVPQTLAEVARVLRPGGMFCFDTINRTIAARLAVIIMAEDVLGLLPKGTHDPALFIKPAELRQLLATAGFRPGRFRGLGPAGLNQRFDFTFAILPFTGIVYIGTARLAGGEAEAS